MRTVRPQAAVAWLVAAAFAAAGAWAQSKTTGAINGRVTDASGAALPGVTVEISSPALIGGARTSQTDDQGYFRFPEIAPGDCRIEWANGGLVRDQSSTATAIEEMVARYISARSTPAGRNSGDKE